ncbi:hypothetical protein E1211_00545 [Micromonospora sp. 15K316]|uniref:hypothetical protein n=1 Tax=Micromonospora sp. 15K316 TaxID=2530376 RepID=UPI00104F0B92|nr:hypothetical protein [Micromonospora sp. 15K316]TDC40633.1 hypothetical protein E1211_00545 [Micromonospora sp. 15K316]
MSAPAIETDLAVSRAAAAARRGELEAAAELLTGLETEDLSVFDLLARIRAQQGRWRDADECWARVQAGDPEHAGAAEGRRILAGIVAGKRPSRPVAQPGRVAVAGGVLVVAAVAGGAVAVAGDDPRRPVATAPAAATSSPTEAGEEQRRRAEELAHRLAQVEAERSAAAERLTTRLDVISRRLTMPGVIVKRGSGTVEVYFREGLFIEDTRLTADGAALLDRVGRRLDGLDASITVVGHSVPVPGGRTSGGSGTALSRAEDAARQLAEASGLPLTAFAMRSAEQSERPFEREARNRTVSLVLTPR